jgi:hypothetical protein
VKCWSISVNTDLIAADQDVLKAWQIKPNKILVCIPSLPGGFYTHNVSPQKLRELESNDEVIYNKHVSLMKSIQKEKSRQTRHVVLVFASDVRFNNEVFSRSRYTSELAVEYISFMVPYTNQYTTVEMPYCCAQWKIAEFEDDENVVDDAEERPENRLASLIRGMNIKESINQDDDETKT